MSPSWRERLSIDLDAHQVRVSRHGRGLRPRLLGQHVEAVTSRDTVATALRKALTACAPARKAQARVVVSAEWVRFALTHGAASLRGATEVQAAAAHTLQRVYGEAAGRWRACAGRAGDDGLLVAGIDSAWFDEVGAALAEHQVRLVSLAPFLVMALNRARRSLREPAWFVVVEPTRVALGYTDGRELRALRSHRRGAELEGDIVRWLDQGRLQQGIDTPGAPVIVVSREGRAIDGARISPSARVIDLGGPAGAEPGVPTT